MREIEVVSSKLPGSQQPTGGWGLESPEGASAPKLLHCPLHASPFPRSLPLNSSPSGGSTPGAYRRGQNNKDQAQLPPGPHVLLPQTTASAQVLLSPQCGATGALNSWKRERRWREMKVYHKDNVLPKVPRSCDPHPHTTPSAMKTVLFRAETAGCMGAFLPVN